MISTTNFRMSNKNKPKHPCSELSCVLSKCVGQDFYCWLTPCPPNNIQTHMFITSISVAIYHVIFQFFCWDKITLTHKAQPFCIQFSTHNKIIWKMYTYNLHKHGVNFHMNGINVQVKTARVCWTIVTIIAWKSCKIY